VDDANGVQARQCQQHVPHDVDGKVDLASAAGSKIFTTAMEGKNQQEGAVTAGTSSQFCLSFV